MENMSIIHNKAIVGFIQSKFGNVMQRSMRRINFQRWFFKREWFSSLYIMYDVHRSFDLAPFIIKIESLFCVGFVQFPELNLIIFSNLCHRTLIVILEMLLFLHT